MVKLTFPSMKTTNILLATSLCVAMASCSGDQQQQQGGAPDIATMTIALGTSELNSSYPTTIKGKTDIDIRPLVSGFITTVHVDEGQHVKKGQALFTLDQVQYQAAVDAAEASVKVAQTAVETTELTEQNKRKLLDKNIISEYEWQLADNDLRQARANLASAQANLVNARKNLSYTVVTSPSDGVVGTIPNREGSLASPSSVTPLTTVSDNSQVYAYFSLNEKDILNLTDNGAKSLAESLKSMPEVSLKLANGDIYESKGKVATVSGVLDNTTGSASVRALFDNPNGMLRSGSTGSVLIPQVTENAIIIPQKSTFELQDRRFVYLLNDSNKVASVAITVSPVNDGKNFVVTSGLKAGDRIAIEGVGTTVRDGMVINPVDPSKQATDAKQN